MPPRLLFITITITIIMTITTTITIISFTVITVLYFQPFLLPLAGLPIGSASRILLQVLFLPFVIWKRCQVPFDNKRQYQVSLYLQKNNSIKYAPSTYLVAQTDDLSDIDIWMSMSIIYISKSKWQRNIVQRCATKYHVCQITMMPSSSETETKHCI